MLAAACVARHTQSGNGNLGSAKACSRRSGSRRLGVWMLLRLQIVTPVPANPQPVRCGFTCEGLKRVIPTLFRSQNERFIQQSSLRRSRLPGRHIDDEETQNWLVFDSISHSGRSSASGPAADDPSLKWRHLCMLLRHEVLQRCPLSQHKPPVNVPNQGHRRLFRFRTLEFAHFRLEDKTVRIPGAE